MRIQNETGRTSKKQTRGTKRDADEALTALIAALEGDLGSRDDSREIHKLLKAETASEHRRRLP